MGIFPEMVVCGDTTVTTSCTKLIYHHAVDQIGTLAPFYMATVTIQL